MLDPNYLAHVSDELEDLFSDLETSILSDVARRIKENKYQNTSTAQYQLNRAKALGLGYDEATKQIAELLNISEQKVADIITEASYGAVSNDNVIFKKAYDKGLIPSFNYNEAGLKDIITKGIIATNGEIHNICKTTATTARNMLTNAMDKTYLSITSGAFSADEAIKIAVDEIGKKGITWIDYGSGTHRRVDSVIRNAIRTGTNQTACKCQDQNFEEMGGNLVEVTSHMGARPSHAEWQGKIYWRKKQYRNYKNFEQTTGYGTGAGLSGYNCRHSFYPFFEGLSSKSFEHYRLKENEELYDLTQQQRYNERMIREWKRRDAVHASAGIDNSKEARKVKEWQQRQKDFLKEHPELKRNYGREKISGNKTLKLTGDNTHSAKEAANSLIAKAKMKDKNITSDLQSAVGRGSGTLTGLDYRIKGSDSLERKLLSKSQASNISIDEYSKRVSDVLRYTNLSDSENITNDFFTILESMKNKGYNMLEVTNTFDVNAPYKGINTLMQDKDGYIFELQFHTPESLKIKDINHKLYEEKRLDTTSENRKRELDKLMVENSSKIKIPNDINRIKNKEAKS